MVAQNIAFRVDASAQIGTGHFMRCLTLADGLKQRGAHIRFVSRHLPEHLRSMLTAKGHEFVLLDSVQNDVTLDELAHAHWLRVSQAQDAADTVKALSDGTWDWLIVDHYALDFRWESVLRQAAKKILVIDDIADRQHDCDILLDQNLYADIEARYIGKVPAHCQLLLGPGYALLREEFIRARNDINISSRTRLLIQFGGSDPLDCTSLTIQAVAPFLNNGIACDVVVGSSYAGLNHLQVLLSKFDSLDIKLHVGINNMASLMNGARLAVAGGGTSTWERCCVGLPTIVIAIAENQIEPLARLCKAGAAHNLGYISTFNSDAVLQTVKAIWHDNIQLSKMAVNARNLVDGCGLKRVLNLLSPIKITNIIKNNKSRFPNYSSRTYLAELSDSHLSQIMVWKNDVQLARQIVSSEEPVTLKEVNDWFVRTLNDSQQALFGIFLNINQTCIGIARLMFIDRAHNTAEIGIYIGAADMRSQGLGREAVMQLLHYSFCDLKLERLHLRVIADNAAARRCYKACGFSEEGIWREHVSINGKRHNMVLMGLLRREFRCEAD